MKQTKIICTIGPASRSKTTIQKMIQAGMNVARINFSHADHEKNAALIHAVREAAAALDRFVPIIQDVQGPRIRTGITPPEGILIERGDMVVCLSQAAYHRFSGAEIPIPIQYPNLSKAVEKNGMIYIQDGTIALQVRSVKEGMIFAVVKEGGVVRSQKGMNAPKAQLRGSVITKKDKADIAFGIQQQVDYIAVSFVKNGNTIKQVKKLLPKKSPIKIIAKIERLEAVENFDEIVKAADGIMIARGDLGVEIGAARVPILQKECIMKCVRAGKPVIVATQMLESMVAESRPTRAEASDVANAVIDHADALMLSAETATGQFPVEAVRAMASIAREVEKTAYDQLPHDEMQHLAEGSPRAVAHASVHLAESMGARAIVVLAQTGETAMAISQLRFKEAQFIVCTNNEKLLRQLSLHWGVQSVFIESKKTKELFLDEMRRVLKQKKIVRSKDPIIVITHFSAVLPGGVAEMVIV